MFIEIIQPVLLFFQAADSAYKLLQEGGLLMGALLVIYGQHKFYKYMIDKLEEKHAGQIQYLEGEYQKLSQAFLNKTNQDSEMMREMIRKSGDR